MRLIVGRLSFFFSLLWIAQVHASGVLAPGYGPLEYDPPLPGSYQLPPIQKAADGNILDSDGNLARLHDLFGDRVVLLSFMFSSCSDVNGCPLSSFVFQKIKTEIQNDLELENGVRLISLSFDPERDTPDRMQLYSNNFHYANSRGDWRFVTTDSIDTLRPILEGYGQEIEKFIDVETGETQDISHLLKVYLIDQQSMIRNIYSVSFLHADLLLNDVRSLLMPLEGPSVQKLNSPAVSKYSRPGDGKDGYESSNYETDSLALALREGRPVNLYNLIESPPLGLPPVPQPSGNIATPEKIKLGRKLFFDRRLSINDTFSCAMCHIPDQGFTSNEMATAVGVEGRSVRRNSPTLYNIAYMDSLFYDAREDNLEQQIWSPFLSRNEMANPSIGYLLGKIRSFPDYDNLFEAAFKGRPVAMDTLGMALAAYQRTLVSGNSAFDRWHFGGEDDVITDEAKRGYDLFIGRAGCSNCHLINEDHALFTDNKLHNTGLGFENSIGSGSGPVRVTLAPGVFLNVDPDIVNTVGEKPPADLGRYEITEDPADRWKYRTPTLRNIALTAPFMHNGRFSSLNEVVAFYNRGGVPHDLQSSLIRPLGLTVQEQNDLVAFMETLTGDNADALVLDAFAAPVGDPIQNDGSVH